MDNLTKPDRSPSHHNHKSYYFKDERASSKKGFSSRQAHSTSQSPSRHKHKPKHRHSHRDYHRKHHHHHHRKHKHYYKHHHRHHSKDKYRRGRSSSSEKDRSRSRIRDHSRPKNRSKSRENQHLLSLNRQGSPFSKTSFKSQYSSGSSSSPSNSAINSTKSEQVGYVESKAMADESVEGIKSKLMQEFLLSKTNSSVPNIPSNIIPTYQSNPQVSEEEEKMLKERAKQLDPRLNRQKQSLATNYTLERQEETQKSHHIQKEEDRQFVVLQLRNRVKRGRQSLIKYHNLKRHEVIVIEDEENPANEESSQGSVEQEDDNQPDYCFELHDSDTDEDEQSIASSPEKSMEKAVVPKIGVSTSLGYIQDPRIQSSQKKGKIKKLNFVMDLDETMINSHYLMMSQDKSNIKLDQSKIVEFVSDSHNFALLIRPYLQQFFQRVSKSYNIFCYSHGHYSYVLQILDLIDPKKEFINRERIFKNTGQVRSDTCKFLSELKFTDEESRETLIMDDIRPIWSTDQGKVIPSKKYAPLKEYMDQKKLQNYTVVKTTYERGQGPPYVIFDMKEQQHYMDCQVQFQESTAQLKYVADALCEMADSYNLKKLQVNAQEEGKAALKLEDIYRERLQKVLNGKKVCILSDSTHRRQNFEFLAKCLGGQIVDDENAKTIFLDANLNQMIKRRLSAILDDRPLIDLLGVHWLTESTFLLKKAPYSGYRIQHESITQREGMI